MKGFKNFIMQGNVVELAVAVVIAGAFGKVVEAFVKLIMDIIGKVIGGQPNFDSLNAGGVVYGTVITALVGFLILAAAVYLMVVKPYEAAQARFKKDTPAEDAPDPQVELLKEIRDAVRANRA